MTHLVLVQQEGDASQNDRQSILRRADRLAGAIAESARGTPPAVHPLLQRRGRIIAQPAYVSSCGSRRSLPGRCHNGELAEHVGDVFVLDEGEMLIPVI
jgi:hypothetical protein